MTSEIKTILVVDDEKDILDALVEIITIVPGRKVVVANTPSEAYMRSVGTKFDLMITDYRMPKTTGADLVKVIRTQKQNSQVPVLVISGFPEEAVLKLKDLSDIHIMSKPFMSDEIMEKVEFLLSQPVKAQTQTVAKPNFDVNVLNEFITSTSSIVRSLTGMQEIKTEKPFLYSKDFNAFVDITGMMPIQTDKFKGTVVLSFPQATFLKLINGFTKENYSEINSENESHVASILTLIKNQVTDNLNSKKIHLLSSNLQVITGNHHRIAVFDQHTTLVIPLKAVIGDFYLFASAG